MIRPPYAAILTGALLWAGGVQAAEPDLLKLDAATQKRLGVVSAPLAAAQRRAAVTGFARALDASPLAVLHTDITAAVAAAEASRLEAERTRTLNAADAAVSTKVAEAARAQSRADAAKVVALRLRIGLEWGPAIARLSDGARAALVNDLAAGRAALVRIDTAGAAPAGLSSLEIDLGSAGHVRATVLGLARSGDARLQSAGLLAKVSGPDALKLPVGMTAPATLAAGGTRTGVVLPRAALLRLGGQTLVYVRKDAGSFEQRAAIGGAPVPQGLFVSQGFSPGEQVVVQGGSMLHAAATAPASEGG